MKQFIVMTAMIMLGVFMFNLIAGGGEGSMLNELAGFFRREIEAKAGVH